MKIKFPPHIQRFLSKLPETGMGSQVLDIILKDGRIIQAVSIFNGEDATSADAFDPESIAGFRGINGRIWMLDQ